VVAQHTFGPGRINTKQRICVQGLPALAISLDDTRARDVAAFRPAARATAALVKVCILQLRAWALVFESCTWSSRQPVWTCSKCALQRLGTLVGRSGRRARLTEGVYMRWPAVAGSGGPPCTACSGCLAAKPVYSSRP
jgi:hypothetical protein